MSKHNTTTEYIGDNEPPPSQSNELGGDSNSVDSEVGHMIIHENPTSPGDSNDSNDHHH